MSKTESVIDKIQVRYNREFGQLKQAVDLVDTVTDALNQPVKDFAGALRGIDELREILRSVYGDFEAAYGNLQESQELFKDLVDGQANTATLINNIVATFMKGDYSILLQAITELDKPLLSEAIKKLPDEMRRKLIIELGGEE